jgi:protein gp37
LSEHSKIEWTDATWNPLRGCLKISPGCKHCYAATFAERFRNVPGHPYEYGFDPRLVPQKLLEPLRWSTSKSVFVNSMSDLFQDDVPEEYIVAVITVMLRANWHTYQVLTKRAGRLRQLLQTRLRDAASARHIWWGVSVEDRKYGVPRIQELRDSPATVRFLSVEPLLEDIGPIDLSDIDWAIVGGESGHGARPMEAAWVEAIREQCEKHGTRFFFKQWGGVQKSKAGRLLNGRTWDEIPDRPPIPVPSKSKRDELARELASIANGWQTTPLVFIPLSNRSTESLESPVDA